MDVTFEEIEPKFREIADRIVWCTFATVDRSGKPRSRILHPIWEGPAGWIATGRYSHKEKHLASNPFVSLSYWDPAHEQAMIDCEASWEDDVDEKQRVWTLFRETPPPLGYDLGSCGKTLRIQHLDYFDLRPWRISTGSLGDVMAGKSDIVCHL
ncbi:MAG: hypothetical protein CM1200mP9_06310 [Gammaproteobacteria bacterium]|nr:MAG: hypothetical protein CM1200mP9_06310 [Gammaproteobacteria bacterium]